MVRKAFLAADITLLNQPTLFFMEASLNFENSMPCTTLEVRSL